MPYTASETRYNQIPYARCGQAGLQLPRMALGLWQNFGSADSLDTMQAMLRTAFDGGINHFDLANNYGPVPGAAEENFGRLLKKDWLPYRDELIISSKAGYLMWPGPYGNGGSRKYMLASLDQSLRRTGLDYFDIFYSHRMDPDTPLEETMGALATAVQQGKALYAGISNYDGPTTARAAAILQELHCPFVVNQSRYSILDRGIERNGLKEWAQQNGLGIVAFSPLAQGLLTEKYLHGIPDNSRIRKGTSLRMTPQTLTPALLAALNTLNDMAAQRGQTLAQMALAWVAADPAVTSVLIGASTPQQIVENLQSLQNTAFMPDELAAIDAAAQGAL
jgi:L-glyceraldehyde 3-phosphate reductase